MDYKIVTCNTTSALEVYVKDLIRQGWKPLGAMTTTNKTKVEYHQTMVKP